ncbi:Uncharacterised protein [Bordetella pertussis]|nr:Uncharacterised protein [Bordetella pertussis]
MFSTWKAIAPPRVSGMSASAKATSAPPCAATRLSPSR